MINADTYYAKIMRPFYFTICFYFGFSVLFVLLAQYNPPLVEAISRFLLPFIDALRFIGIPFRDGYIDGPFPQHTYHTLVGVSIWFAVVWSIMFALPFVLYVFVTDDPIRYPRTLVKRDMSLYSGKILWARFGSLVVLFINGAIFFDGVTGFLTFHVRDIVIMVLWPAAVAFAGYGFFLILLFWASFLYLDLRNLKRLLIRFF